MEPLKPFEHVAVEPPKETEKAPLSLHIRPCVQVVPHLLFTPVHYEPGYAYPLLVWLHGPGASERQLIRIMPNISLRNYLAVAVRGLELPKPQGSPNAAGSEAGKGETRYGWPQSPAAVAEATHRVFRAIELASAKRHVHPDRIFLAGSRSGGTMAFQIAFREPTYFAGVISLGGPLPRQGLFLRNFSKLGHLEVLLAVTRNCPSYPISLVCEHLRLLHRAGLGGIMLREYPAGWHLGLSMLRDVDRWLMERITQGSSSPRK